MSYYSYRFVLLGVAVGNSILTIVYEKVFIGWLNWCWEARAKTKQ